jgi:hypothetical protein
MTKIYILTIDPASSWNALELVDPLSAQYADLGTIAVQAVGGKAGKYLIQASVSIEVLEAKPEPEAEANGNGNGKEASLVF